MAMVRCVTEMGMGVDVHGLDYTKAATRAVFDAIHHSSLGFQRMLGKTADDMHVAVTIGVSKPDQVDHHLLSRAPCRPRRSVVATVPVGRRQELVDGHAVEARQAVQSGYGYGALTPFVGPEDRCLELRLRPGLDVLQREPLLPADQPDTFPEPVAVLGLVPVDAVAIFSYHRT